MPRGRRLRGAGSRRFVSSTSYARPIRTLADLLSRDPWFGRRRAATRFQAGAATCVPCDGAHAVFSVFGWVAVRSQTAAAARGVMKGKADKRGPVMVGQLGRLRPGGRLWRSFGQPIGSCLHGPPSWDFGTVYFDPAIASRRRLRVWSGVSGLWFQGCSLIHVSKATAWEFGLVSETVFSIVWFPCGAGAATGAG